MDQLKNRALVAFSTALHAVVTDWGCLGTGRVEQLPCGLPGIYLGLYAAGVPPLGTTCELFQVSNHPVQVSLIVL